METDLKRMLEIAVAAGDKAAGVAALRRVFGDRPSLANAQLVLKHAKQLGGENAREEFKVAVLRAYTVEPMLPLLEAYAALAGLDLRVQVGEFNTYMQDILNPDSWLYSFLPRMIILAVQTRDLLPALCDRAAELTPADSNKLVDDALRQLRHLLDIVSSRCKASVIVPTLDIPPYPSAGILDAQAPWGQRAAIDAFNHGLREIAASATGVYVVDMEALAGRFGRSRWYDEQKWNMARLPFAADALPEIAREYFKYVHVLSGKLCKVVAVDLDNTIWGGIVGEDGMDGIQVGLDHRGAAYLQLQRVLLDIYHRGILLAICSKNNREEAMAVLEKHPRMLLRPSHFAAMRINWEDKARNLREIAAELNLGLDAIAFVDDNPAERDRVRQELPEVQVIELPDDPALYASTVAQCPYCERLSVSDEDRDRSRYYAQERQRRVAQLATNSLEDFYRSLKMDVEIGEATPESIPRIAQLTQKTNQFNVTTRRYSEQEITAMAQQTASRVYWLRSRDRFGDNGIVGVGIARLEGDTCTIDTLLLSCRVIGRTIETALLAEIATQARADGARYLEGRFVPTAKNAPAKDFYARHGFTRAEKDGNGASRWRLDLAQSVLNWPEWIDRAGVLQRS